MRWYALLLCLPILAQTANQTVNDPGKELDVAASAQWIDTGVDLRAGDSVQFTTTGTLNLGPGKSAGPQGAQRGFRDLIKAYPVNEAGLGALIGRIGSSDAAVPFLIGAGRQMQVSRAGRLFVSVNKASTDNPDGSFHVKVGFTSRGPEASTTPVNYKLAEVTTAMIDRIPAEDAQGSTPGVFRHKMHGTHGDRRDVSFRRPRDGGSFDPGIGGGGHEQRSAGCKIRQPVFARCGRRKIRIPETGLGANSFCKRLRRRAWI